MEGGEEKRKGRAKESVFDESKKGSDAIIMESESKVNTNLCLEHLFIFCSSSFPSQLSPLLIICLNKILSSIHQFKHLYSSQKKKKKMARATATARKSTGGRASRKRLGAKAARKTPAKKKGTRKFKPGSK